MLVTTYVTMSTACKMKAYPFMSKANSRFKSATNLNCLLIAYTVVAVATTIKQINTFALVSKNLR